MHPKIEHIFTVSHPMQYINALEYCHKFSLPKESCAVLIFNKPFGIQIQQLKATVNPNDWGHLEFIPYPNYWIEPGKKRTFKGKLKVSYSKITSAWSFNKRIKTFLTEQCASPIKVIGTGNYLSRPHRHLMATAQKFNGVNEYVLLDEGTSIPHVVVPLRHNPDAKLMGKKNTRFSKHDWVGKTLELLTPLRSNTPEKVTFFTIFEDITPPQQDTIVVNDFGHTKQHLDEFRTTNELWFIGTCFVEHNITTAEKYLKLIQTVKTTFPNQNIVYLPHRYEAQENLKNIAALGITILRPDMAIEPWMITHKKKPTHMAALASSAVSNINRIFGGAVPFTLFRPGESFFDTTERFKLWHKLIEDTAKESTSNVKILEFYNQG